MRACAAVPIPEGAFRTCARCAKRQPLYHSRCSICGFSLGAVAPRSGPAILPRGWVEEATSTGGLILRQTPWARLFENFTWLVIPAAAVATEFLALTPLFQKLAFDLAEALLFLALLSIGFWVVSRHHEEWSVGPNYLELKSRFFRKRKLEVFEGARLVLIRINRWGGHTPVWNRELRDSWVESTWQLVVEQDGRRRVLYHGHLWSGKAALRFGRYLAERTGWSLHEGEELIC